MAGLLYILVIDIFREIYPAPPWRGFFFCVKIKYCGILPQMTEILSATKEKDISDMCRILNYDIKKEDEGMMLRDVIKREFHLVSHDMSRAKYETEKGICINDRQVLVNHIVKEGERLTVRLTDRPAGNIVPTKGDLDILYEDEDVIVLNKPAGIVVHPSHGHFADSLGNFVAWHYEESGHPHEVRTIGRLDKDTSGIIMYGKSRTVCAIMLQQTQEKLRVKTYLALAEGVFAESSGTIDAPISREYEDKIRRVVREDGDWAVTHYVVEKQFADYALVRVTIDTGRTHQIRVHMAHIGHPLLGDILYGKGPMDGLDRAALHAYHTTFCLPFSGEPMEITAPLPEDMRRFCINGGLQKLWNKI